MGCDIYEFEDVKIFFADDEACLCNWPYNTEKIYLADLRLLAMLGAAVVMAYHGQIDRNFTYFILPHDLPAYVVEGIDQLVNERWDNKRIITLFVAQLEKLLEQHHKLNENCGDNCFCHNVNNFLSDYYDPKDAE